MFPNLNSGPERIGMGLVGQTTVTCGGSTAVSDSAALEQDFGEIKGAWLCLALASVG